MVDVTVPKKDLLIKYGVQLISLHLGDMTGDLYREFYKNKNNGIIITSLREILSEVIGPAKAEYEMKKILNKIK